MTDLRSASLVAKLRGDFWLLPIDEVALRDFVTRCCLDLKAPQSQDGGVKEGDPPQPLQIEMKMMPLGELNALVAHFYLTADSKTC